ncbi:MAG: hypothetical protein KGM16_20005 [Bacteroidota bacterium]|nr:hypothetical protein [Bacteroidota bacterium]
MAKIPDGVLGTLIGRVGPVTGYIRNGENILRSAHSRSDRKVTAARIAQRDKIKVCNEFTKAFSGTGFFNKTFPAYGSSGTGYNRATSAIMNLAITQSATGIGINYSEVLISKGVLPPAVAVIATATPESNISFQWHDNSGNGTAKPNDKVILVACFAEIRQAIFTIGTATRMQCQSLLETKTLKGFTAETWVGFLSNDETNASNSSYCGSIEL